MWRKKLLLIALLVSTIDVMAFWLAVDGPITPGSMSSFRQFLGSIFLFIYVLTYVPIASPRIDLLSIVGAWIKLPLYPQQSGYSVPWAIVCDFVGDLVVCYIYITLFWLIRSFWQRYARARLRRNL